MAKHHHLPKYNELLNPLLQALHDLGGSDTIEEISSKVSELIDLPEDVLNILHDPDKGSRTEVEYRLAWARTYLKKYGLIDNSDRGVWLIVPEKQGISEVDPQHVVKTVRETFRKNRDARPPSEDSEEGLPEEEESWRTRLHQILTQELSPDAFERLVKRMLRESGFVQVEVTGRTGDGGIDGKRIVKVGGLLCFHVLFQCKKYQGSVSSGAIRDFRGALIGRADKGLFVTTGTFTRDGATPIDLMDGDQLAEKLKELQLGMKTEMVENVEVDAEWFRNI